MVIFVYIWTNRRLFLYYKSICVVKEYVGVYCEIG